MIFNTFYQAKLMARLASYATGEVTPIEKSGSSLYVVKNNYLTYQDGFRLLQHPNGNNYSYPQFEFPELTAFYIFNRIIADEKSKKPTWLKKSELVKIYSFMHETIDRLKIKHFRIQINLAMTAGDMNYQSDAYIQKLAESYAKEDKYREYDEDKEEWDVQQNNLLELEEYVKEEIQELGLNFTPKSIGVNFEMPLFSNIDAENEKLDDGDFEDVINNFERKDVMVSAEEFENQLARWNGDPEKDDHGYWNGYDWIYTKEEGDGEDRTIIRR